MKLTPRQELAKWTIKNNRFTFIEAMRQQGLTTCLLETAIEKCLENENYSVLYMCDSFAAVNHIAKDAYDRLKEIKNDEVIIEVTLNGIHFNNGSRLIFSPKPVPGLTANFVICDNYFSLKENLNIIIPIAASDNGSMVIGFSYKESENLPEYYTKLFESDFVKAFGKINWRESSPGTKIIF